MSLSKTLIVVIVFVLLGYGIYYFFIDTLSFSELSGRQSSPMGSILVNLLDFDTGLTRWDAYNLKKKAIVWQEKQKYIFSIQNPELRRIENEKLMAEMMQDPGFKKLSRKILGFGGKGASGILNALVGFSLF